MTLPHLSAATDARRPLPYHQLARSSPRFRWWRLVAGTVVLAVLIPVTARLPGVVHRLLWPGNLPGLGAVTDLALLLAGIALGTPLVLAVTRFIGARRIGTLLSVTGQMPWRQLGREIGIGMACGLLPGLLVGIGLLFGIGLLVAPGGQPLIETGLAALIVPMLTLLLLIPVQSSTEELMRGWLIQAIPVTSVWPGMLLQSVVFAALHGTDGTVWGYAYLVGLSLLFGAITLITGSLTRVIALHVFQNSLAAVATMMSVAIGTATEQSLMSTAADSGWQAPTIHLTLLGGCTLFMWWRRRHRSPQPAKLAAAAGFADAPAARHTEAAHEPSTPPPGVSPPVS